MMKTTIDLPEKLVKQVKLRALHDGRKLKETVADLLRKGLAADTSQIKSTAKPIIGKDRVTGLPVIITPASPAPGEELSPDQIAELLLAQEVEWHHAASR